MLQTSIKNGNKHFVKPHEAVSSTACEVLELVYAIYL